MLPQQETTVRVRSGKTEFGSTRRGSATVARQRAHGMEAIRLPRPESGLVVTCFRLSAHLSRAVGHPAWTTVSITQTSAKRCPAQPQPQLLQAETKVGNPQQTKPCAPLRFGRLSHEKKTPGATRKTTGRPDAYLPRAPLY
jgi:hypothetical protein